MHCAMAAVNGAAFLQADFTAACSDAGCRIVSGLNMAADPASHLAVLGCKGWGACEAWVVDDCAAVRTLATKLRHTRSGADCKGALNAFLNSRWSSTAFKPCSHALSCMQRASTRNGEVTCASMQLPGEQGRCKARLPSAMHASELRT